MEKTPWFEPHTHPKRRGLYERDWRETDILPEEDRCIHMDLWEPVRNPRDILYPGVWYVSPGWNDASRQNLPWRGVVRPNVELTGSGRLHRPESE